LGPFELGFELGEGISLPLVPKVREPQPQGGTELVQEIEPAGMGRDHDEASLRSEDPGDFLEHPVVAFHVLQVIKTEDEAERSVPEGEVFAGALDKAAL